jgi:S-adenosylmethionine:tRNA ribosyltransferase-isomerase
VKAEDLAAHRMHEESFELGAESADLINNARRAGRRIWAVGTTSVRVLESVAARTGGELAPMKGRTNLFVYPPRPFKTVDGMVTNFHLPESTLLMLVSAFAAPGELGGREKVLRAYAEAVRERYRFFSYGDAMLLV